MRYHLNEKGPAICRAKSDDSCPLGAKDSSSIHYETKELAQTAFEEKLAQEHGGNLTASKKTPKVIETEFDPFSLVEDPPGAKSGTIVRAKDGTLLIVSDNDTYNEFGAYMVGNLTNEPEIAAKLHKLDPRKNYQEGSCDSLSFALLEANEDIVAVDELVNESGEMWHSIARHKDGYYIDSLGKWSEQDLYDYWESIGIREDEGEFSFKYDVHEEPGKNPNFAPEDSLKPLVVYLNSLTK